MLEILGLTNSRNKFSVKKYKKIAIKISVFKIIARLFDLFVCRFWQNPLWQNPFSDKKKR